MTAVTTTFRRGRTAIAPVWDHRIWGPVVKALLLFVVVIEGVLQYQFGRVPVLGIGHGRGPIPVEIMLLGLVFGSLYALIGMFFQAEDGIRDLYVTGVQTCA